MKSGLLHRGQAGGGHWAGAGADQPPALAYLLKHARLKLAELTAAALAPYGLDGRELAVLLVLAGCEPGIPAAGLRPLLVRLHDAKVKPPLHAAAPRLWLLDSVGASSKAPSHRILYKFWYTLGMAAPK